MELRYLYVGTSDTESDVATWLQVPGATVLWRFRHFGADVAAISLGSPPTLLLADHRPSGSVLPIYAVDDLRTAVHAMNTHGWTVDLASVETPEGPAALVHSASGTELALCRSTDRTRWNTPSRPRTTSMPFVRVGERAGEVCGWAGRGIFPA